MDTSPLRIGTRGSKLALVQAGMVRDGLLRAWPGLAVEIAVIRTTGDRVQDRPLAEIGGKGLFTKEIEEALAAGGIDLAVHSMKDVPTVLPEGLVIDCLLPRADPRDAWIGPPLDALPAGAVVGTASLRRRAQVLALRQDLSVAPLRGNVDTRLAKLAAGEVAATILAEAGLARLGLTIARTVLEPAAMLPAVAQGVVGVERRAGDARTARLLAPLHDAATARCVAAERTLLARLDGSCRTPIAGFAVARGDLLVLEGMVADPDGSNLRRARGEAADPVALGHLVADRLAP